MTRKVYTTFILSASITRRVTYAKLTHTVAEGRYTTAPYLFPAGCVGLPIKHSDIPQAFIQSDLDSKQSYMDLPKGISLRDTDGKLHTTVKLKRALYGLKQSPQLWSKALNKFFIQECGFTRATRMIL